MTSFLRTTVLFSIALCALACSKSEPATSTQVSSTVASSTVSTTAAPTPATPAPAPAAANTAPATIPPAVGTPNAIATADGEKPGLRIDVTELKRSSGGTVMMKFVLANNSQEKASLCCHWLGDGAFGNPDYSSVGAVHLIDPVGKKKYFVIRDAEHQCVCSREVAAVPPGEKTNLWAKFPAPPPDVQKVSIVVPHFTPMDDVPIQ
jgi:hypothetical protein